VSLSPNGRSEAAQLGRQLRNRLATEVVSSPRLRTRQTAELIANQLGVTLRIDRRLDEIDYGTWTLRTFRSLAADPQWQCWNAERSRSCPPGGETMAEAARRMIEALRDIAQRQTSLASIIVSHAEPIRAALLALQAMSFDDWAQIDLPTCHFTRIDWDNDAFNVLAVESA
jgi:broad specificity phosphatase PhoE